MAKYQYQAVQEQHSHPDIGTYTAWGIKGWQTGDGNSAVIAYIPDVFLHQQDAEHFASLCTKRNLAICHLSDAVEDYLV